VVSKGYLGIEKDDTNGERCELQMSLDNILWRFCSLPYRL
jgi:hypothetical protein